MRIPLLLAAVLVAPISALAGTPLTITWEGTVDFNSIASGPLSAPTVGQPVTLSFPIDSDAFVDSPNFPTRGYVIDPADVTLAFPSLSVGLQSPFPGTPYFVIRNDDPAVDGFFVATSIDSPTGVPLSVNGAFGKFVNAASVTYGGGTLDSLDVLDAVGTYDFTGLTVFGWSIDDGPFNAMGIIYSSLTIGVDAGWSDEGCALAGAAGVPLLAGSGVPTPGAGNAWDLTGAAPSATAALFFAVASTPAPFKGGTLKPVPFFPPLVLATSGAGTISLPFTFPAGVPSGTSLWAQYAIVDAGGPKGIALSNAIVGTVP